LRAGSDRDAALTTAGRGSIEASLAPLRDDPAAAAVLSDLDGTLAPIVDDPEAAAVPAEARELLRCLCERYALVACVTGRRALDARAIVAVDGVVVAGNHGLEILGPGEAEPAPARELAGREGAARDFALALDQAELAAAGLRLEDKGAIQALHWRGAADEGRAAEVATAAAEAARGAALAPRWGRKVLEIRPAVEIDKGTAVRDLLAGREVELAMFGGDDRTDLDAFEGLAELVRRGTLRAAVRVGVDSSEAPPGLEEGCDLLVDGTGGFLEVLRYLAGGG
jgi:trehalose 6-phosphate phosphatase